jgi:hypothetical protein
MIYENLKIKRMLSYQRNYGALFKFGLFRYRTGLSRQVILCFRSVPSSAIGLLSSGAVSLGLWNFTLIQTVYFNSSADIPSAMLKPLLTMLFLLLFTYGETGGGGQVCLVSGGDDLVFFAR